MDQAAAELLLAGDAADGVPEYLDDLDPDEVADVAADIWSQLKAAGAESPIPHGADDVDDDEDDQDELGQAGLDPLDAHGPAASPSLPEFDLTAELLERHRKAKHESTAALSVLQRFQERTSERANAVTTQRERLLWGARGIIVLSKFSRLHVAVLQDHAGEIDSWQFFHNGPRGIAADVVVHLAFRKVLSGYACRLRDDHMGRYVYPASEQWDPRLDVSVPPAIVPFPSGPFSGLPLPISPSHKHTTSWLTFSTSCLQSS